MPERFVQAGIRRNGLHAIRGWCLQRLKLATEPADLGQLVKTWDWKDPPGHWYAWSVARAQTDQIVQSLEMFRYVTLESYPLDLVLEAAAAAGARLILHYRSLENWLASSVKLGERDENQEWNQIMHMECVTNWVDYRVYAERPDPAHVVIDYDRWLVDREYRTSLAARLGCPDDGSPFTDKAHESSFDPEDYVTPERLLNRGAEMRKSQKYKDLLAHGRKLLKETIRAQQP